MGKDSLLYYLFTYAHNKQPSKPFNVLPIKQYMKSSKSLQCVWVKKSTAIKY